MGYWGKGDEVGKGIPSVYFTNRTLFYFPPLPSPPLISTPVKPAMWRSAVKRIWCTLELSEDTLVAIILNILRWTFHSKSIKI